MLAARWQFAGWNFPGLIDHSEKDGGCTFYMTVLRSEIV
jgi:hypothetical protein